MRRLIFIGISLLYLTIEHVAQSEISIGFSHSRGFYEKPFQLKLKASKGDIYYSLDGSIPLPDVGSVYQKGLDISTTSVVRAVAINGSDTSQVFTHSYLFPEKVMEQPDSIPGWPLREVFTHYRGYPVLMDYAMDPEIVQSPVYQGDLLKAFQEIPSVMVTMPISDFFKVHFSEAELPSYLEILYPGSEVEHEAAFAGIEGTSHKLLKRSFRLSFKKKYGDKNFKSQVFREFDVLHGESATGKFDQLVLRGGTQRCWARRWYPDKTAYTRDQWYRDTQLALSGFGAHGTFVHLFVNGVYCGLYNLTERPDEKFMASYFKGKDDDFYSFNHNGSLSGDEGRWKYLFDTLITEDLMVPETFQKFESYLDIHSYFDYLIASWISGMGDWPVNNFYGGYNAKLGSPMVFVGWDAEVTWDYDPYEGHLGAWVHEYFLADAEADSEIDALWHAGRQNPNFLMTFADRVYLHCFNGGALTDSAQRHRWHTLNKSIENAIVAESARWGDALDDSTTRTRDKHWRREVDRVDSLMRGNVAKFIKALRAEGYYPSIDPPAIAFKADESGQEGIKVSLSHNNPAGGIYYRLDGGDPRSRSGGIAKEAELFSESLSCEAGTTVMARVKNGKEWSALRRLVCD